MLASVSLLLIVFFGLTIAVLDLLFRDLSERSMGELLDAQLIALLAVSETDDHRNPQPAGPLAEARLRQPGSGLYAVIRAQDGTLIWRSPSLLGRETSLGSTVKPDERRIERQRLDDGSEVMTLSAPIDWELEPGVSRPFVFSVATSVAPYEKQLRRFRQQMFGWFLGLFVLLLGSLAVLLRWALQPVRRIEREIREVETGERQALGSAWPTELRGLAANMNTLLASERRRVEHYRNTLGNLAHSLKTPLAVIRSTLSSGGAPVHGSVIDQQVGRMDAIVQHQLRRAAAAGGAVVGQAGVDMAPVLNELRAAMGKVYGDKDLMIEVVVAEDIRFAGDRGDLFELSGNLLDNACKWCRSHVRVSARRELDALGRARVRLKLEDDGSGVAIADRERILERGTRVDEQVDGQGLGLAMVREIVALYGGELTIGDSALGGASIEVVLPAR
ncbi:MAG TPA: ATP-binding protein [Steroidobacteraceae bacterium]|nr:ATP-binding protein [Steroidobacteraceae bacterium]